MIRVGVVVVDALSVVKKKKDKECAVFFFKQKTAYEV